jgi:hypothetical protein
MKQSQLKSLIKLIITEALDGQAHDQTDSRTAETIARSLWPDVKEVIPSGNLPNGAQVFSAKGGDGTQYLAKTKDNKWKYVAYEDGKKNTAHWVDYDPNALKEESSTGGVAGYSTPFAFSKNKKGSPKGIEAASKYGKVVGEAPRV